MVTNNDQQGAEKDKSLLIGLGLDNDDGHVRVTRGANFRLLGGSQDTHEQMQEQTIKFSEKLDQRGRKLDDVSREEFLDLAHEAGMNVIPEDLKDSRQQKLARTRPPRRLANLTHVFNRY